MKRSKQRYFLIAGIILILVVGSAVLLKVFFYSGKKSMGPSDSFSAIKNGEVHLQNTITLDFEPAKGFTAMDNLYKGKAHSGSYSAKVFGKNTFSLAIDKKAGEIRPDLLKGVALSAWVYVFPYDGKIEASLVFSTSSATNKPVWQGVSLLGDRIPEGKWFKISGYFNLSEAVIGPDDMIHIYFWNNCGAEILVDDFYVVFGDPHRDRPGDTTYADMTKGPFVPHMNRPPYPFLFLQKTSVSNNDLDFLIPGDGKNEGSLQPGDIPVCGDLLPDPSGLDELLILHPGQTAEIAGYCQAEKKFGGGAVNLNGLQCPVSPANVVCGNFDGKTGDELLFIEPAKLMLTKLRKEGNFCGKTACKTELKTIWEASPSVLNVAVCDSNVLFCSLDADGNGTDELLVVTGKSWSLFSFTGAGWKNSASSGFLNLKNWNPTVNHIALTSGRFCSKVNADALLVRWKQKKGKEQGYNLYAFDRQKAAFRPVLPAGSKGSAPVSGRDSLRWTDLLIPFSVPGGNHEMLMRYHNGWRFDLKTISFTDSTFRIHATVDFTGYRGDRNPKYFEQLLIVPGHYLSPGETSLIVSGCNCSKPPVSGRPCEKVVNYKFLPNSVQLYRIPFQH